MTRVAGYPLVRLVELGEEGSKSDEVWLVAGSKVLLRRRALFDFGSEDPARTQSLATFLLNE